MSVPPEKEIKTLLGRLSLKLIALHKELLSFQTRGVEQEDQRRYNPYQVLQMSLQDERFAWMRVLSKLIIRIDIMISDDKDREALDASSIADQIHKLFSGAYSDFYDHYRMALESEPPLALIQAEISKILSDFS